MTTQHHHLSGDHTPPAPARDAGDTGDMGDIGDGGVEGAVWARWALGLGLLVALGAGAATAHGLFEVSRAAQVPAQVAWLYPLITDGLALVAYASTARLAGSARGYAWAVVVLAAGVSGLAQAVYLAGGVATAPPALRFGVGAWPAVAAAIAAHLLFLLAEARKPRPRPQHRPQHTPAQPLTQPQAHDPSQTPRVAQPTASASRAVHPSGSRDAVQTGPATRDSVQPAPVQRPPVPAPTIRQTPVQRSGVQSAGVQRPGVQRPGVQHAGSRTLPSPATDRAISQARLYAGRHGQLPTVSQLEKLAEVSRGTAGAALKELRENGPGLHLVTKNQTTTEHQHAETSHHDDTTDESSKAQP
jgi:hypothetical protein